MVAVALLAVEVLLVNNVSDRSAIKTREKSYVLAVILFPLEVLLARNVSDKRGIRKWREILRGSSNSFDCRSATSEEC